MGFAINGRRQVVDDGVEQRLHALVLERRAAEDRVERAGDDRLADQRLESRFIRLDTIEISSHRVVVEFDGSLEKLEAVFGSLFGEVGRDVFIVNLAPRPSSSQTTAFMRTRSMMPLKLFSEPIGIWMHTGLPATRSTISSTQL